MSPLPLERFITRKVPFAYRGERMQLELSQSLFSSHDVDHGSLLLLKSLAHCPLESGAAVLDLGCGTGVIGIALARANPGARVWFQDRDALALSFTARNAAACSVPPGGIFGGLALQGIDASFDLIVSNLPAKAGEPVHLDILRRMGRCLLPGGLAALVVVAPLEERIRVGLEGAGLDASVAARGTEHVVFHARRKVDGPPSAEDPLAPYLRHRARFSHASTSYEASTAYDIPEFDTLSYQTALALETAESAGLVETLDRPVLVWNPGQGHLPAWLLARRGEGRAFSLTLASRDALALAVSARNTSKAGPRTVHAWDPAACGGPFGVAFLFPDDEPHAGWDEYLPRYLAEALVAGGTAVVSAGATFIARLLRHCRGLAVDRSRKKSGSRSVLLRRP